jgi:O-antigen/teichoic acid export membrane protein
VVAPLAFSGALLVAYTTLSIAATRAHRTDRFWHVAVAGAVVNLVLNLLLIPGYGMRGAAAATVAAYAVLAIGMALLAQRLYPVPYEWKRLAVATGAGIALYALGRVLDVPLAAAIALIAAYPVLLGLLGFYQPAERRRLVTLAARMRPR